MTLTICIYCSEPGPFSDEHVFPAGLGGDDKRYLLTDLVCRECNEVRLSKIEASFMRSSPHSLARMFLQNHGRRRGSKVRPPKLDSTMTAIVCDDGAIAEAEIQPKGKPPKLLMQYVLQSNGDVLFTGDDSGDPGSFFESVRQALVDCIDTVRKVHVAAQSHFEVSSMTWDGTVYTPIAYEKVDKPPKNCIWLEPLHQSTKSTDELPMPRFFQRSGGQLVLRATSDDDIGSLLGRVRRAVLAAILPGPDAYRTLVNPLVHSSMTIDLGHYQRTYAKLGFNFLLHAFGDTYGRHHSFNRVRNGIIYGKPNITVNQLDTFPLLDDLPKDMHVLALTSMKARAGRYSIAAYVRLYGGKVKLVLLSMKAPEPPIKDPIFMLVHYNQHRIEMLSSTEFARHIKPVIPQAEREQSELEYIYSIWPNLNPRLKH